MKRNSILKLRQYVVCLVLVFSFVFVEAVPGKQKEDFQVKYLPGMTQIPSFNHYAGYLEVDEKRGDHLFFWLFESVSSPETDPLLVWLTGGPGCSSIDAMFEENGPFRITKSCEVTLDPYGWNYRANIVYVDQPVGTSFSYSKTSHYLSSQFEVNQQFYSFLQKFYDVFPEYKSRPLYLTGESYAGHFIPSMATYILEQNEKQKKEDKIKLAGLVIGNAWVDPKIHFEVVPDVVYGFSLMDEDDKNEAAALYSKAIKGGGCPVLNDFGKPPAIPQPAKYSEADMVIWEQEYTGITAPPGLEGNPCVEKLKEVLEDYNGKTIMSTLSCVDFVKIMGITGNCPEDIREVLPPILKVFAGDGKFDDLLFRLLFRYSIQRVISFTARHQEYINAMDMLEYGPVTLDGNPVNWPDDDKELKDYLSDDKVQKAIHAESFPYESVPTCNPLVSFNLLDDYYKSSLYLLPRLLNRMPVLLYSGQNDLICSPMGTGKFLAELARSPEKWPGQERYLEAKNIPWYVFEQRAGYYKNSGNLSFLIVLNASHMVPLSQPRFAQVMINNFIHNERFIEKKERKR